MAQNNIFTAKSRWWWWLLLLVTLLAITMVAIWVYNPNNFKQRISNAFAAASADPKAFTPQQLEEFHATSVALATAAANAPTSISTAIPTPQIKPTPAPTAQALLNLSGVDAIKVDPEQSYTINEISSWQDGLFIESQPNPLNQEIKSTGNKYQDAHNANLLYMERTYIVRVGDIPTWDSMGQWITATGGTLIKGDLSKDARQIEEEQIPLMDGTNATVVAGVQLKPVHIEATYPGAISTDQPFYLKEGGRAYQPDPKNNAHILTNGGTLSQLTYWGNMNNWGRTLWDDSRSFGPEANPHKALQNQYGLQVSATAPTAMPSDSGNASNGCLTLAQLNSDYSGGIDTGAQGAREGLLYDGETLAGAVVKINGTQIETLKGLGWTIQGSNPDVRSAWSPAQCRPLVDGR